MDKVNRMTAKQARQLSEEQARLANEASIKWVNDNCLEIIDEILSIIQDFIMNSDTQEEFCDIWTGSYIKERMTNTTRIYLEKRIEAYLNSLGYDIVFHQDDISYTRTKRYLRVVW